MINIGQKIRQRREKLNLKQTDLAHALMVSPQAVSKWERSETCPDITLLVQLAQILDVSTDYLLGATELEQGIFEATVFCTSLSQFAMKSLIMKSKELAEYINIIFHHLTDTVLKYDAVPVKYLGDGFLCFFSGANHADRALEAAIYSKRVIQNELLKISINSGPIFLGTIGHPDYCSKDICGETVNVAFLMLEDVIKNCKNGIGISENTVKSLKTNYSLTGKHKAFLNLIESEIIIYEPQESEL